MQNHVHLCQCSRCVIHLLPVDGHSCRCFVCCLEQERTGATGRVVDRLVLALRLVNPNDLRHDARHFRWCIELSLALARLSGEVTHEIFISVTQDIIAFRTVLAKVEGWIGKNSDEIGEAILHLLTLAKLIGIVEVRHINHALEIVSLGKLRNNLVDLVADLFIALERNHVVKATTLRYHDQRTRLTRIFIRDILDEEQDQHIILVLRSVHTATQLVATFPK